MSADGHRWTDRSHVDTSTHLQWSQRVDGTGTPRGLLYRGQYKTTKLGDCAIYSQPTINMNTLSQYHARFGRSERMASPLVRIEPKSYPFTLKHSFPEPKFHHGHRRLGKPDLLHGTADGENRQRLFRPISRPIVRLSEGRG